ncbi:hypothetical protein RF644_17770 [Kocuria sp. CPCC 205258]|uniref:hypothetical protein n=1 Tax=Kocuria sp. CPCC 205258 TaxID=3073552 RepID=UPI0034D5352D
MDTTEPAIVPDSLSAHAAALGLTPLERPHTIEEAIETAGPDGVLVAVVEIPLAEMFTAHDREEDGEKGLIARRVVEDCPAPFQLEFECCGARNGNPLIVARFDIQDALYDFDGDITDKELAEIRVSGAV